MAKNKNKQKYKAQNKLAAPNAIGPLEQALRLTNYDICGYNQSLSNANGYYNLNPELLTLQYYLVTNLYKTFGILGKIVDIPVDDAYKDGAFTLETDLLEEDEVVKLQRTIQEKDLDKIKTGRKWARLYGGGALIAADGPDLSSPLREDKQCYKTI